MASRYFSLGHAKLYPSDRMLLVNDAPAVIGNRAFDLLLTLVERPRQLVTKSELLERVWSGLVVENNNIAAQVMALRKLLGAELIETVPGHGYRLNADPEIGEARPNTAARAADVPASRPLRIGPRLYGRQQDMRQLSELLQQPGWLTLTGPAGVGKTALAQGLAFAWHGPAVWIDLAALSQAAQVLPALARELGLTALDGPDAAALLPDALVVLDNAEHVRSGVAVAAEFLRRVAPTTRLLVTSLAPVGGEGERVRSIRPLAVDGLATLPGEAPEDDSALREGAVGLLVARIEAADRRLRIGLRQLPLLQELCQRLDGLPLAIEMAAVRVPLLGLQGVCDALDQRFALLKSGERRTRSRHPTLQTALDWSHDLLAPDEQLLFAKLAVFAGGFTLRLVFDLIVDTPSDFSAGDREADRWQVIDRLGKLIDHSLVMTDAGEPPRYRLLETVRAYALERLRRLGPAEMAIVYRRHAEQVLKLFQEASRTSADAPASRRDAARDRSLAELDNARAAFDWCLKHDAAMAIGLSIEVARLAVNLAIDLDLLSADSFWDSEAFLWMSACEPLLTSHHEVSAELRADWWRAYALQLLIRKDSRAATAARQAADICRQLGDDVGLYWSSTVLLRSVARAEARPIDQLQPALADLTETLARHPEWPAAVRRVDVATRQLIDGRAPPDGDGWLQQARWSVDDSLDDRVPELRYLLASVQAPPPKVEAHS